MAAPSRDRRIETLDVHLLRPDPPVAPRIAAIEALARRLTPAFYLDLGRPCNSACIYCSVPPHLDTKGFLPAGEIRPAIEAARDTGLTKVILIGGEPTLRKDIVERVAELKAEGFDEIIVMTNGQRLADRGFADALIDAGITTVHLSLDDHRPEVLERMTRREGTLDKALAALENIAPHPDLFIYVYSVVARTNHEGLPDHVAFIAEQQRRLGRPLMSVVSFIKPVGDAWTHRDTLMMPASEAVPSLVRALEVAAAEGLPMGYRNWQPCFLPDWAHHNVDHYLFDHSVRVTDREALRNTHDSYRRFPELCDPCRFRPICDGVYEGYEQLYGLGELRPQVAP